MTHLSYILLKIISNYRCGTFVPNKHHKVLLFDSEISCPLQGLMCWQFPLKHWLVQDLLSLLRRCKPVQKFEEQFGHIILLQAIIQESLSPNRLSHDQFIVIDDPVFQYTGHPTCLIIFSHHTSEIFDSVPLLVNASSLMFTVLDYVQRKQWSLTIEKFDNAVSIENINTHNGSRPLIRYKQNQKLLNIKKKMYMLSRP